jgi:hypothetical protein
MLCLGFEEENAMLLPYMVLCMHFKENRCSDRSCIIKKTASRRDKYF